MTEVPDPIVLTETELLEACEGGQPEQLILRNLIHTMFSLVSGNLSVENLTISGQLLLPDGATMTMDNGGVLQLSGGSELQVTEDSNATFAGGVVASTLTCQGNADFNTVSGTTDFHAPAGFLSTVSMSGLPTADAAPNELWKDGGAANVVKVST